MVPNILLKSLIFLVLLYGYPCSVDMDTVSRGVQGCEGVNAVRIPRSRVLMQ